jgi:hypothetical protein
VRDADTVTVTKAKLFSPPYLDKGLSQPLRVEGRSTEGEARHRLYFLRTKGHGNLVVSWSGRAKLPAKGERVKVHMGGVGWARVLHYFVQHGFLGCVVAADQLPEWMHESCPDGKVHIFGCDLDA